MDAPQLFRTVAEHAPKARRMLEQERDSLRERMAEVVSQLVELDNLEAPARRMTPNAGTLEEE